jgi:hypothetical protein
MAGEDRALIVAKFWYQMDTFLTRGNVGITRVEVVQPNTEPEAACEIVKESVVCSCALDQDGQG